MHPRCRLPNKSFLLYEPGIRKARYKTGSPPRYCCRSAPESELGQARAVSALPRSLQLRLLALSQFRELEAHVRFPQIVRIHTIALFGRVLQIFRPRRFSISLILTWSSSRARNDFAVLLPRLLNCQRFSL